MKRKYKTLMVSSLFVGNSGEDISGEIIWSGHSISHLSALRLANINRCYYCSGIQYKILKKEDGKKWKIKETTYRQYGAVCSMVRGKWKEIKK